jgi:hypothetical protein
LRSRVEESICSSGGVVTLKCFDSALVLVVRVLQQRYLAIFLNSNLYRKYLSELFSQIQTGPYKSGSGSSSGGGRKTSRRAFGQLRRTGSNTSLSTCSSSEVVVHFVPVSASLPLDIYVPPQHYILGQREYLYAKHSARHVPFKVDHTELVRHLHHARGGPRQHLAPTKLVCRRFRQHWSH